MPLPTWESFRSRPPHAPPLIMAHRGASDDLPENTMASFALALAQGADVLETDLRFTRDDAIVLMHDATVERTTDGYGAVSEMTLAETKQLHARRPHAADAGDQQVPALAELLQFTDVPLALELKDGRFALESDARRLVELLAQHDALERCAVISFHLPLLRRIKALAPRMPIGMISMANPLPLYPTEFIGPFFPLLYVNPLYVWWARRRGSLTCPLDPAPEPRLRYYRWLGVPVLLSNHPAVTKRAWNAL